MSVKKLVILDRDGVINQESPDFVKSPDEWIPIPGSLEAIVALKKAGWLVAVATNQSGVGRGLYSEAMLGRIHAKMQSAVEAQGGVIDHIAYCPHIPDDHCDCRKPKPGLLLAVQKVFGLSSLKGVPAIGDSMRDLEAAEAAGALPLLVKTGNGVMTLKKYPEQTEKIEICANLFEAANFLLKKH